MPPFERFARRFALATIAGAVVLSVGCSSTDPDDLDGDAGADPTIDSGEPTDSVDGGEPTDGGHGGEPIDSGEPIGGGDGGEPIDSGGGSVDAGTQLAPVFLEPSTYADLVIINSAFPFGVTQRHEADDSIAGSRWGRHGGPMVTTGIYGGAGEPTVVRWTLPDDATSAATRTDIAFATAGNLPTTFFYGADGMVDLPFGNLSLLSYTGVGAPFSGEALLYSATYDQVTSRADVNGFYSGAGVDTAEGPFLVFSALSSLAPSPSSTNDNGLYATQICNGALVSSACAPSWRLFGWNGSSGPVVTDNHGNIFVGASVSGGATSDAVYGLAKSQLVVSATAEATTIHSVDTQGTSSLAAIPPEGAAPGWVLGLGYDPSRGIYAASYTEQGGRLESGSRVVDDALAPANNVDGLSVFADPEGDLWLAVSKGSAGVYLELRRSPP